MKRAVAMKKPVNLWIGNNPDPEKRLQVYVSNADLERVRQLRELGQETDVIDLNTNKTLRVSRASCGLRNCHCALALVKRHGAGVTRKRRTATTHTLSGKRIPASVRRARAGLIPSEETEGLDRHPVIPIALDKISREALEKIAVSIHRELENRGYLVIGYWSPEESEGVDTGHAVERITELGNETLEILRGL